jgi:hypothetical protein
MLIHRDTVPRRGRRQGRAACQEELQGAVALTAAVKRQPRPSSVRVNSRSSPNALRNTDICTFRFSCVRREGLATRKKRALPWRPEIHRPAARPLEDRMPECPTLLARRRRSVASSAGAFGNDRIRAQLFGLSSATGLGCCVPGSHGAVQPRHRYPSSLLSPRFDICSATWRAPHSRSVGSDSARVPVKSGNAR